LGIGIKGLCKKEALGTLPRAFLFVAGWRKYMGIEPTWGSLHYSTPDLKSDGMWALTAGYSSFFQAL